MARCAISRIDDLNAGAAGATAIGPGDTDRQSVQVVQSLLSGQGASGLPNLQSADYGVFGPATSTAVENFRLHNGLPLGNQVDVRTLQTLVQTPALTPIVSRGYLTLVLDFNYSGLARILSVVAQMEGGGKFGALNLNRDKAGLSFGLIQWAQKPGRLAEILNAFFSASPAGFVRIFGAGNASLANGLLVHTKQMSGGVDTATGRTTDLNFDLVNEPWVGRFRTSALWVPFQQVQVRTAISDFQGSLAMVQQYAPQLDTERAVGFALDLANQFGDAGARGIYRSVCQAGMSLSALLQGMARESVERIQDPWKAATQARRDLFLTTSFLSDNA
ncbi:MAG: hypothetical protein WAK21_12080, partial [Candidatus Sulfotelmatobacter sp.]